MNRIRELRKERGLLQKDLAEMLGVTQGTLSNWEKGRHDPDNNALKFLATLFEVSVDYILNRSEIKTPTFDIEDGQLDEINELLVQLSEDGQKQALSYIKFLLGEEQE